LIVARVIPRRPGFFFFFPMLVLSKVHKLEDELNQNVRPIRHE